MQGIFARYATWKNLSTVIFGHNPQIFPHTFPHPILSKFVKRDLRDVTHYNMITAHTVFSENQIRQLLPKNTKFVTILREPFSLLQSAFKFFNLCKRFNMSVCTLSEFLTSPETYDKRSNISYVKRYAASATKNFMARHLGFDDFSPPGLNITDWIEYIDERFHFIGLVEYLPESLVYMRRVLNWSTKDILSLPVRSHTSNEKSAISAKYLQLVNQTIVPELKKKYRSWSPVDHRQ
jgi:hypothetical protein